MDDDNSSDGSKNTGGSGKNTLFFTIEPSQTNFFCPNCRKSKSISKFETAANHSQYMISPRATMNDRCKFVSNDTKNDSFDGMIPVISYGNNDVQFKCAICERLDKQAKEEMFKKVKQRQRKGTQKGTYKLKGLWTHMKRYHLQDLIESGAVKKKKLDKDNTEVNGDAAKNQNGDNKTIERHGNTNSNNSIIKTRRVRNQKLKCTQASCENEYCESGILKQLRVCPECALKHFEKSLDKVEFVFDDSLLPKVGDRIYGLFVISNKKRPKEFKWYPGKVLKKPIYKGMMTIKVEWDDGDDADIKQEEKGWSFE